MPAPPWPLPFPSTWPSLPVSMCPRTKRKRTRARRPSASPFGHGAQYAERGHVTPGPPPSFGHGALYAQKGRMRDATRSLSLPHSHGREVHEGMLPPFAPGPSPSSMAAPSWTRRKGHAWARHPRPFPSPFARKGGAREHAAQQSPLAVSWYARKGLTPAPVYTQRGHGKVSPPAPICANGGTTHEPPSHCLPPFLHKGGTGAPPTPVRRSDARTDRGCAPLHAHPCAARRAGAAHKLRGSTRLGGAPPHPGFHTGA
ncbi:hypothetical protein EDB89DRAFT_1904445 [Lactarius sanguifluus]|nr:hypothetical protein EDB89DRAFT_1904445 [Lactarius sanguifluus]